MRPTFGKIEKERLAEGLKRPHYPMHCTFTVRKYFSIKPHVAATVLHSFARASSRRNPDFVSPTNIVRVRQVPQRIIFQSPPSMNINILRIENAVVLYFRNARG
jgi:hypothetical protein